KSDGGDLSDECFLALFVQTLIQRSEIRGDPGWVALVEIVNEPFPVVPLHSAVSYRVDHCKPRGLACGVSGRKHRNRTVACCGPQVLSNCGPSASTFVLRLVHTGAVGPWNSLARGHDYGNGR